MGASTTTFTNDTDVPIPDLSTAESAIAVSGIVSPVTSITVTLTLTHTYDDDLDILLIDPEGNTIALSLNNGGSDDNYTATIFSDQSLNPISGGTAPFTGTFAPEQNLANLLPGLINGSWTLRIVDEVAVDEGNLETWSLNFTHSNVIEGTAAAETLTGSANSELISAGLGNDTLVPMGGNDTCVGGPGSDNFLLNTAPDPTNVDFFSDFSHKFDTVQVLTSVFTEVNPGKLKAKFFSEGKVAKDGNDLFAYNKGTGALLYDADNKGGAAGVIVAILPDHIKFGANDIFGV
jgi:subtilisin-like proprotein convertase family protein